MVWTIVRIIGRTGARSRSGVPGTPAPANLFLNQAEQLSEEDRKGLVIYLLYGISGVPLGPDDEEVEMQEVEMDSGAVTPHQPRRISKSSWPRQSMRTVRTMRLTGGAERARVSPSCQANASQSFPKTAPRRRPD